MNKEILNQWRVTKYNPNYRNNEGHYTKPEEWTSASDIGKIIDSKTFTIEEYLQIEQTYINAIIHIIKLNNVESVRILNFKKNNMDKRSPLYESKFHLLNFKEDSEISIENIPTLSRMVLREFIFCHFYSNDFFIHFGYDYYLYFGSNSVQTKQIEDVVDESLFVEEMRSPFYISEKDVKRTIEWSRIGGEIIEGEETLLKISLYEFRRELGISDNHPVIGVFPITKESSSFFRGKMNHNMDFNKNNYFLVAGD
ncbi:hypothetical protein LG307_03155 [Sutcliffiella horikoshii]|uniref:DUF7683 domain-containing protein n=1 Tax=Sutcliffiella horikoshii TaxID=79883 RepID=UPI0038500F48